MPRGVYLRTGRKWKPKTVKKHYRALARQAIATEHMSTVSRKGRTMDMVEDIHGQVTKALGYIGDGKRLIAQGWDLINSIPKRI